MSDIPHSSSLDSGHDEECDDNSGYSEDRENELLVEFDGPDQRRESEDGCPGFVPGTRADQGPQGEERSEPRVPRNGTLVLGGSTSDSSGVSLPCNREYVEKPTFILGSPADQGPQAVEKSKPNVPKSGTFVLDGSKSDSPDVSPKNDGEYEGKPTFILGSPADQGPQEIEKSKPNVPKSGTFVLDGSKSDSPDVSPKNDGEYEGKPTFVLGSPADQEPPGDERSETDVPRSGTRVLGTSAFPSSDRFPESEEVPPNRRTNILGADAADHKHADPRSSEHREIPRGDIDQRDLEPVADEAGEGPDSRSRALSTIRACLLGASNDSKDSDPKEADHGESDDRRPNRQTSVLDAPVGARPGNDHSTVREGTNNRASSFDTTAVGRPGRGGESNGIPTEKPTYVIGTPAKSGPGDIRHSGQSAATRLSDDSVPRTTTSVEVELPCAAVSSKQLVGQLAITTLAVVVCAACAALSSGVWTLMYGGSIAAWVFGTTSFWRYLSLSRRVAAQKSRPSRAPRQ